MGKQPWWSVKLKIARRHAHEGGHPACESTKNVWFPTIAGKTVQLIVFTLKNA
jgi:hypothetical protein